MQSELFVAHAVCIVIGNGASTVSIFQRWREDIRVFSKLEPNLHSTCYATVFDMATVELHCIRGDWWGIAVYCTWPIHVILMQLSGVRPDGMKLKSTDIYVDCSYTIFGLRSQLGQPIGRIRFAGNRRRCDNYLLIGSFLVLQSHEQLQSSHDELNWNHLISIWLRCINLSIWPKIHLDATILMLNLRLSIGIDTSVCL